MCHSPNILSPDKDPLGQAVLSYYKTKQSKDILIKSDIAEDDIIPSAYFFRSGKNIPVLERKALKQCNGRILDIGSAAGCHALELQMSGMDVTALEISSLCCQVMQQRGVEKIINQDFYTTTGQKYDTLLLLMNGIGLARTLEGLKEFFQKAEILLNQGGQIIFDSSDISYIYEEEDGSRWVNLNTNYYGEIKYKMIFDHYEGEEFPWLFIDFDTLKSIAAKHGFGTYPLATGKHYDYLGVMKKE